MKITNNSQSPQGVRAISGVVYIKPGQTRDLELTDAGLVQAKRLPFLGIEGVSRDLSAAPSSPPPSNGIDPLDHDGNGKKGGAKKLDPLPDNLDDMKRDELDALAEARGVDISEAKNKGDVIAALQLSVEPA
jgi:hypothetical protein